MPSDRQRALEDFLASVDRPAVVDAVTRAGAADERTAARKLDVYLNEVRVGLDLLEPYLDDRPRMLEVGAGIGALSAFLASQGHDVVGIEPAGPGFDLVRALREAIDDDLGDVGRSVIDAGVDEIPDDLQSVDLVFSVHVLEHVPDVANAIAAMHRCLRPDGRSVHVCPNYAFPFDPHFGVPLVPGRPGATAHLLPARVSGSALWGSLNFVTAGQIREIAEHSELDVTFRPGVLGEMVDRLDTDPVFRDRHARLVALSDVAFRRLRLRALLDRWPAGLASPMIFELRRKDSS